MSTTKTSGRIKRCNQNACSSKTEKRRLIHTPARKYHFMLGTTSRVPGAPGWHYLILDLDSKKDLTKTAEFLIYSDFHYASQPTESGYHVFTPLKMRLKPMLTRAIKLGADRTWARLALKRGWAFLADKGEVKIPWPVERMVIGWRKNSLDTVTKRAHPTSNK